MIPEILRRGAARGEAPEVALRHHLLEGLLRRLARSDHVDAFVVRGGLMTRAWVGGRATRDLDLVGDCAFDLEAISSRLREVLAVEVRDGLAIDPARVRTQGIWLDTDWPGVRAHVDVRLDGHPHPVTLDVGFGDPLVPDAVTLPYPALLDHPDCVVRAVRPETQVGWKLHGLAEFGATWRPKDLADLWRITGAVPLEPGALVEAIDVAFASRRFTRRQAVEVLSLPHWRTKTARVRWKGQRGVPELERTLDDLRTRLAPAIGALEEP